jgi:hypothetical protein
MISNSGSESKNIFKDRIKLTSLIFLFFTVAFAFSFFLYNYKIFALFNLYDLFVCIFCLILSNLI